jgi:hypothetical protein
MGSTAPTAEAPSSSWWSYTGTASIGAMQIRDSGARMVRPRVARGRRRPRRWRRSVRCWSRFGAVVDALRSASEGDGRRPCAPLARWAGSPSMTPGWSTWRPSPDELGLPFHTPEVGPPSEDKLYQREALRSAGLPTPGARGPPGRRRPGSSRADRLGDQLSRGVEAAQGVRQLAHLPGEPAWTSSASAGRNWRRASQKIGSSRSTCPTDPHAGRASRPTTSRWRRWRSRGR